MSWAEELTPDDDVEVDIIYPQFYTDHNIATMKKYSAAAAYYCRAAATLNKDKVRFSLPGITVIQVYSLEEAMKVYGIKMTHKFVNGLCWIYADVSGLSKFLDEIEEGDGP